MYSEREYLNLKLTFLQNMTLVKYSLKFPFSDSIWNVLGGTNPSLPRMWEHVDCPPEPVGCLCDLCMHSAGSHWLTEHVHLCPALHSSGGLKLVTNTTCKSVSETTAPTFILSISLPPSWWLIKHLPC